MNFLKWLILVIVIITGYFAYKYFWPTVYDDISLKASDAQVPLAEVCDFQGGATVVVEINEDGPEPNCLKVTANQSLKVINNTEQEVRIGFSDLPIQALGLGNIKLPPVGEYSIVMNFSQYLAPGVHYLRVSSFSGPEIWLVGNQKL